MRILFDRLFHSIAMFLIVVALPSVVRGDVLPPPPTVPGTNISMPGPFAIAISGILITAATAWAAMKSRRTSEGIPSKVAILAAALLLPVTIMATLFSYMVHEEYWQRILLLVTGGVFWAIATFVAWLIIRRRRSRDCETPVE